MQDNISKLWTIKKKNVTKLNAKSHKKNTKTYFQLTTPSVSDMNNSEQPQKKTKDYYKEYKICLNIGMEKLKFLD